MAVGVVVELEVIEGDILVLVLEPGSTLKRICSEQIAALSAGIYVITRLRGKASADPIRR
jgi:hypothetical protein